MAKVVLGSVLLLLLYATVSQCGREHVTGGALELELGDGEQIFQADGGSIRFWRETERALQNANVALEEIILEENALTIPKYKDAGSVCYVLEGKGVVGISHPLQGEFRGRQRVGRVEKGDVFAVPRGVVVWLYNEGKERHRVFCALETKDELQAGQQKVFHLAGTGGRFGGILHGFSRNVLAKAWNVDEGTVGKLLDAQKETCIVKPREHIRFPQPNGEETDMINRYSEDIQEIAAQGRFVHNSESEFPDLFVRNAGWIRVINRHKLPILRGLQMSALRGNLKNEALCAPYWVLNAYQIIRVTKGRGRIQVADENGKQVLDTEAKEGSVYVIPQFYPVLKTDAGGGFEWVSFLTSDRPIPSFLAGDNSVYRGIPEEVMAAAQAVDVETIRRVSDARVGDEVILRPGEGKPRKEAAAAAAHSTA
eukprot:c26197_g1_i1 orf=151-1422(-)